MKTKLLVALATPFFLVACSNEEQVTPNAQNQAKVQKTYAYRQISIETEAPVASCAYEIIDEKSANIIFEIPENYKVSMRTVDKSYIINLETNEPRDSENLVRNTEKFNAIDGKINLTFEVNGIAIRKPKPVIEL